MFALTFRVVAIYIVGAYEQKFLPEEFKRTKDMRPLEVKNFDLETFSKLPS